MALHTFHKKVVPYPIWPTILFYERKVLMAKHAFMVAFYSK